MKFTELGLNPDLMRGIQDLGFETCTDVQAETFTRTLEYRDVAVQSQTGTGKTAAFLITIFQLMNESEQFKNTRALIVAPTRELAVQIENDAKALGKYLPQRTGCFYGGVGYGQQERDLADKVQIVIGTPGRLLDFSQSGKLDFREMGILVVDEADRLFDMGFYPDIRKMMRRARPRTERLTMLYSATLSTNVRNISWQFMNDPVEIEIQSESMTVDTVEQELYHVSKDEKFSLMLGLLKREQPRNAIIFCNTKRATEIVSKKLELNGFRSDFIIGDLPQQKRLKIIERVKAGDVGLLTATDVAARGLHVDDLDLVINYDIPEDPEAYVHRIGRTARAGRKGKAISLACERFVYGLEPIEELIGMKIPSGEFSEDLLAEDESRGKHLGTSHGPDRPPRKRNDSRGRPGTRPPRPADRSGPSRSQSHHPHTPRQAAADAGTETGGRRSSGPRKSSRGPRPGADRTERESSRRESPRRESPRRDPQVGADKGPSRESSMNERLAYYEKKYGEDFASKSGKSKSSGPERAARQSPRTNQPNQPKKATAEPGAGAKSDNEAKTTEKKRGLIGKLKGLFKGDA